MMFDGSTATLSFDGPVPGVPGAVIREVESLPEHLLGAAQIGPCTEAMPGALLFEVPGIARYLVRDGNTIEVAVAPNADRGAAELFLNGSARGTLIHQRGELPLTATTLIAPNWKCVAICGPSAFGKSTLAAELCRRGWRLLADDVTRVNWNGSMVIAWPSSDRLKLWRDACEAVRLDASALEPVREGLEKFYAPVPAAATPAALAITVCLEIAPIAQIKRFPSAESASLLSGATFRPRQIDPLGRRPDHERMILQVSRNCRTMRLEGARMCAVGELADRLEEAIR
jgi:hypothetical protein